MAAQLAKPASRQAALSAEAQALSQSPTGEGAPKVQLPGEGWEIRAYTGGTQTDAAALPSGAAQIRLDGGQGQVTVSVVSWIDSMKAKMAAGR